MTATAPNERLIRLPEVLKMVSVSKSTWERMVARGDAPPRIKLGQRTTVWKEQAVREWMESLQPKGAAN